MPSSASCGRRRGACVVPVSWSTLLSTESSTPIRALCQIAESGAAPRVASEAKRRDGDPLHCQVGMARSRHGVQGEHDKHPTEPEDFDDDASYGVTEGGVLFITTVDGRIRTYSPSFWLVVDESNPSSSFAF